MTDCYATEDDLIVDINGGDYILSELPRQCFSRRNGQCGSKTVKQAVACPITYTISAAPSQVNPGATVTVSWTASVSVSDSHWIGQYLVGATNTI